MAEVGLGANFGGIGVNEGPLLSGRSRVHILPFHLSNQSHSWGLVWYSCSCLLVNESWLDANIPGTFDSCDSSVRIDVKNDPTTSSSL